MSYDLYPSEVDQFNDDSSKNKELINFKRADRGFNKIYRNIVRESDDKIIKKKIELYSTGGTGSNIRDAETGEYYSELVGSKYEDLYFKVSLATGECTSLNGSSTLFYLSPEHYERHLYVELDNYTKFNWEEKKNALLDEMNKTAKKTRL
jgi:hypothetical protein